MTEEMKEKKPRFVYFFKGDKQERAQVANFASRMQNWQGLQSYIIDMRKDSQAIVDVLAKRNPEKKDMIKKMLEENTFMFTNKTQDIEFFEAELVL